MVPTDVAFIQRREGYRRQRGRYTAPITIATGAPGTQSPPARSLRGCVRTRRHHRVRHHLGRQTHAHHGSAQHAGDHLRLLNSALSVRLPDIGANGGARSTLPRRATWRFGQLRRERIERPGPARFPRTTWDFGDGTDRLRPQRRRQPTSYAATAARSATPASVKVTDNVVCQQRPGRRPVTVTGTAWASDQLRGQLRRRHRLRRQRAPTTTSIDDAPVGTTPRGVADQSRRLPRSTSPINPTTSASSARRPTPSRAQWPQATLPATSR